MKDGIILKFGLVSLDRLKERCKRLLTQVCWETSAVCRDHLTTSYPPRLLELLFSCQLRYLAIYKEFHRIKDLEALLKQCSHPSKMLVRTSRIRLRKEKNNYSYSPDIY